MTVIYCNTKLFVLFLCNKIFLKINPDLFPKSWESLKKTLKLFAFLRCRIYFIIWRAVQILLAIISNIDLEFILKGVFLTFRLTLKSFFF